MGDDSLTAWSPRPATVMTRGLFDIEPRKAYCGDCKGKGFDLSPGRRHSRKCQRCRGKGSVTVGSTKR